MGIREEFLRDLKDQMWVSSGPELECAEWAARWMAERCAKESEEHYGVGIKIRQLARELKEHEGKP